LLDPDDKTVLQYTALQSGAFTLDTVPEGKYLLHFDDVADVENEEYVRMYQAADRLLIVQSDNSALYFSLAENLNRDSPQCRRLLHGSLRPQTAQLQRAIHRILREHAQVV
jgi:hypothetical protein